MEKNKNVSNEEKQKDEQNPTLNSPGSKVTDYGNTTGGSANKVVEQSNKKDNVKQNNPGVGSEGQE